MPGIDISSMSNETRERYFDLRSRETLGQLGEFDRLELQALRHEFSIDE